MSAKRVARVVAKVEPHWVGDGFPVRSLFSYHVGADEFDPFLLLDYAGPAKFAPTLERRGVGEQPHRGFETVTIVYQGEVEHRDSAGNHGSIGPGDVQWMTAASGVVHEEFHGRSFGAIGGTLEMVQIWVNLPAKDKSSPPRYQEIHASSIPIVELPNDAGTVRVIAGELAAAKGPAKTFTPLQLWDLRLRAGKQIELPVAAGDTALVVVQEGAVDFQDGPAVHAVQLAVMERNGSRIVLKANDADAKALLLAGRPIGEPVVGHGPFVMNTHEEIKQAFADYRAGKMGMLA